MKIHSRHILMYLMATLTILVLGLWSLAEASPITYSFYSNNNDSYWTLASEPIPGQGFNLDQASFRISILGDTTYPVDTTTFPGVSSISGLTGSLTVSGMLWDTTNTPVPYTFSGYFVDLPLYFFVSPGVDPDPSLVGFGSENSDDYLAVVFASLMGLDSWNLKSSFGPITGAFSYSRADMVLDAGIITLETADQITFSAPEPSTMLLLGLGLVGMAGVRRFRK